MGTENIWERIKKTGEGKFYRVEYTDKDKTEEAKRKRAEKYVEGAKGQKHLISTSIANNTYITNVIKVYVYGDTEAEKQLYKEPLLSDKETQELQELQKKLGIDLSKYKEDLAKEMEVKKDNIPVVKPKKIKL